MSFSSAIGCSYDARDRARSTIGPRAARIAARDPRGLALRRGAGCRYASSRPSAPRRCGARERDRKGRGAFPSLSLLPSRTGHEARSALASRDFSCPGPSPTPHSRGPLRGSERTVGGLQQMHETQVEGGGRLELSPPSSRLAAAAVVVAVEAVWIICFEGVNHGGQQEYEDDVVQSVTGATLTRSAAARYECDRHDDGDRDGGTREEGAAVPKPLLAGGKEDRG